MSFLVRLEFEAADGTVMHDETVVADVSALEQVEQGVTYLGGRGTLRITFDPPLVARVVLDEAEAS